MTNKLFQVIDFDRVLFDTKKFAKTLTDTLADTDPKLADALLQSFNESYAQGVTFFLLRYLRDVLGDQFEDFVATAVSRAGGAEVFLCPGAKERIALADSLTTVRPSWGILTYGDGIDQMMKIKLVGLDSAPVLITTTPNKAEVMATWQQANGTFLLPEEFGGTAVDTLTLEDDKLRAFQNLPENVHGIWVNIVSDDALLERVVRVDDLAGASKYLLDTIALRK